MLTRVKWEEHQPTSECCHWWTLSSKLFEMHTSRLLHSHLKNQNCSFEVEAWNVERDGQFCLLHKWLTLLYHLAREMYQTLTEHTKLDQSLGYSEVIASSELKILGLVFHRTSTLKMYWSLGLCHWSLVSEIFISFNPFNFFFAYVCHCTCYFSVTYFLVQS